MEIKNKILVVTPKPNSRENINGYLLRICDANGYRKSSKLLSLAGIDIQIHSPMIFDVSKIAPLLGHNEEDINFIGYLDKIDVHKVHPAEINILGHKINRRFVNLSKPKICPHCIKENGYIESVWSIQFITICPKHKIKLINKCPSCKKQLSQYRRGQLRCSCGGELEDSTYEKIGNKKVIGLTEILINSLCNESLNTELSRINGFPSTELKLISPNSFCWIIDNLVRVKIINENKIGENASVYKNLDKYSIMETAANVLVNWPEGFHQLIDSVRMDLKNNEIEQLKSRFNKIYEFLFNSTLPKKDIQFLRNEFISYENSYIKSSYIDKRLTKSLDEDLYLIGITALSEEIGVHPKTIHRLMLKGYINVYGEMLSHRRRYIFDRKAINISKVTARQNISERDAAKLIGIPVSVLQELRNRGIYENTRLGNKVNSYTKWCIEKLNRKIKFGINVMSVNNYDPKTHILLCEVMRMKLGSPEEKTNFICDFMDRKIEPLGVMAYDSARITFDRKEVDEYLNISKTKNINGRYVAEAAKLLHCDPSIITVLVMDGYLDAHKNNKGVVVTEKSLNNFSTKYISCAWISKILSTSTKKIIFMCEKNEIYLISFVRTYGRSPQPFIERKYLGKFGLDLTVSN